MTQVSKYIMFNGDLISTNNPFVQSTDRSYLYGDGLFESIRMINGNAQLLADHYNRLVNGMQYLQMEIPVNFSVSYFRNQIKLLTDGNKMFGNARIRLQVTRNGGGLYKPDDQSVSWLMSCNPMKEHSYAMNNKGIMMGCYRENEKPAGPLSGIKSTSAQYYVHASLWSNQNGFDDCFLINNQGLIAEATSSNVFVLDKKQLYTPPDTDGCVAGVMRNHIMKICRDEGMSVHEASLRPEDLLDMDEVFLTNAISGIKWVGGIASKRYYNAVTREIQNLLNSRIVF
jgi:branched-chain amino acid aminotransferase